MVPSILNCSAEERRRRWRRALVKEYVTLVAAPVKKALPEIADGLAAFVTCALGFIALATILLMF